MSLHISGGLRLYVGGAVVGAEVKMWGWCRCMYRASDGSMGHNGLPLSHLYTLHA